MHPSRLVAYNAVYTGTRSQLFGKFGASISWVTLQRILKIKATSSRNVGNEILLYTTPYLKDRNFQTPYTFIDYRSFLYTNLWSCYAQCMSAGA
jgi:hypothetical protein